MQLVIDKGESSITNLLISFGVMIEYNLDSSSFIIHPITPKICQLYQNLKNVTLPLVFHYNRSDCWAFSAIIFKCTLQNAFNRSFLANFKL